ncbi:uncharacterized protein HKW66_Vig0230320 [Vigna angularis]|uniref:AAA+ ATPase domain-containing protein n=1 Tax=Phaseolus angularis TaxID=3914 RepID=A0A8T0KAC4_PHAAN|nr:uncharacterized protein HKW66_Vig0230320 [Vigna angularis]
MLGFTLPFQLRCCQHLSQQPPLPSPISPKPFYPPVVPSVPRPRIGPGLRASFPVLSGSVFPEDEPDVELGRLLSLLPEEMRRRVSDHAELPQLIEVVMDLGRKPLARFPSGDFVISEYPITVQDIEHATAQVGDFAIDNRAGISRTLHRISAIRNRKGTIIGLTCRAGRAISGSAMLLQDLIKDGASLLLIGPPGVGKTTIIREIARMLANDYKKRVMIVDTSNEIGGDGDIPHAGIGNARRMQVPNSDAQHKSVTLGDEEASRRGVQKTVLERKGPSTFSCGVEIISKTELRIHRSLEATVDAILSGRFPNVEIRKMKSQEQEEILDHGPISDSSLQKNGEIMFEEVTKGADDQTSQNESLFKLHVDLVEDSWEHKSPLGLFCYGILDATVNQGIKQLKINDAAIQLTDNISEANALLALQSKLKKNPGIQAAAKSHDIPIYVTKTSSLEHVTKAIRALLSDYEDGIKDFEVPDKIKSLEMIDALEWRIYHGDSHTAMVVCAFAGVAKLVALGGTFLSRSWSRLTPSQRRGSRQLCVGLDGFLYHDGHCSLIQIWLDADKIEVSTISPVPSQICFVARCFDVAAATVGVGSISRRCSQLPPSQSDVVASISCRIFFGQD